ncbi:MAG: diguanylate cyclase [Sulfuricurvum sp.]|jgi:diguanylate cyclase (GGDEF)-like protein|uniref:diguanylate cyclase domain-containing protein n=1 Tax=Sulfuricurvum sp. TaxID=2025608 RepID=UPI0025D72C43|nr:diguanylate cyclase [Sulfuricurvum sp.]MCK9373305.1 diguanylate cyclase [Sulfuricurvum sp.]
MTFSELVDIEILQELWDSFSGIYPIATAIIDLEGNVLVASHWQRICTAFHRLNPDSLSRCIESDTVLANALKAGDAYTVYQCKNGLVDVAVPIIINGNHIANFFTGQFFFETPDKEFFIRQGQELNFNREAYLAAVEEVPVIPEARLKSLMDFLVKQVEVLAIAGKATLMLQQSNLKLKKNEEQLEEIVRERTTQLKMIDDFQTQFIVHTDPFDMYEKLLDELLKLTDSPFGLIGEVLYEEGGAPYLKTYALSNIAWDEETNRLYEQYQRTGFEFRKLDNLFGHVITEKKVLLSNDPANDPRRAGTPPGHPPIESFLGIPVFNGTTLVGEIGLANREGGYDSTIVEMLKPLAKTCGQIIVARQEKEALARAQHQLKELANNDGLTGIPNRRRFDEYLQQEWRRAAREDVALVLIMIDIDFFKLYNDRYGHLAGDECLKKFAAILKNCLRRPADMVARYGGEEFVSLLPDSTLQGALTIAECFHEMLRNEAIEHQDSTISDRVTVSTGIAIAYPTHESDPTILIDMADKNLYRAKERGRNRIAVS